MYAIGSYAMHVVKEGGGASLSATHAYCQDAQPLRPRHGASEIKCRAIAWRGAYHPRKLR